MVLRLDSIVTSAFPVISASNFAVYSGRVPSEHTYCITGLFSSICLKIHLVTTLSGYRAAFYGGGAAARAAACCEGAGAAHSLY